MSRSFEELASELHALETVDKSTFRRRARVLQSLWRHDLGYACGEHRGRPLGSRLPMPWARESLANYLTPTIREVVRTEVCDPIRAAGKLFGKPRIFNDLLSSQPLAFNLFGELQRDRDLATQLIADLTAGRFAEVTSVGFEESPGRSDPKYTGDRSAFDVFIECRTGRGAPAFLGIEVKYHESLEDKAASHRSRYDELATLMRCFTSAALAQLRETPLQQIWRDHLLAGSLLQGSVYEDGAFVFLYPRDNTHCASAIGAYTACLSDPSSLLVWTLEAVLASLRRYSHAPWISAFHERYLDFGRIERALSGREIR